MNTPDALLKALHILTREGKLNADSRRKLKQVQHLVQLIRPVLERTLQACGGLKVIDMGAGKSYLGFLLYEDFLKNHPEARLTSIESRPDLVTRARALADEIHFDRMDFLCASIAEIPPTLTADLVVALHACDTATDEAILFGLSRKVRAFALVPCCQAEVARGLAALPSASLDDLGTLFEFPIHRREFGSHLTNVLRTLALKSEGYRVTATELVGWEHSLKNELILAEKVSDPTHPESRRAQHALQTLRARFPVPMRLFQKEA